MSSRSCRVRLVGAALLLLAAQVVEARQATGRVAIEAVAAASTTSTAADDPFLVADVTGTVRLGRGWEAVFRPWGARRPGGDWMLQIYQLQVRYTSSTRVPVRLDAGIISSPIGLATLELRADRNPTISAPSYYFAPLPAMDGRFDRVQVLSGGYPVGAIVSSSGAWWDLRTGITDGTPARLRNMVSDVRPPAEPQLIVGGGVTPTVRLRFGAGFARGRYRSRGLNSVGSPIEPQTATVLNAEAEYAIGYTRITGEWIRDRFTTTAGPAVARGISVQAMRTLTPRWFAAGRITHASTDVIVGLNPGRRTAAANEAVLGYRIATEFTVRGGYQASRSMGNPAWRHAAIVSGVWSKRWF